MFTYSYKYFRARFSQFSVTTGPTDMFILYICMVYTSNIRVVRLRNGYIILVTWRGILYVYKGASSHYLPNLIRHKGG